ncbi:MAG: hypothetical protein HON90_00210 [Halobacteriovoraceae bacterium]|nr:hypothetical protein [Halobacteriovoraceae bacterium]
MLFSQEEKVNDKNEPMTTQQFFAGGATIMALLGSLWVSKNERKIEIFYFNNYEEIYLIGWGLIVLALGVLVYVIRKNTKELAKRAKLLFESCYRDETKIPIGKTLDGLEINLSDTERTSHVQIIGSTGRGKTHSLVVPWILRDLQRNTPVVLIDGKGSPDVVEDIKNMSDQFFKPGSSRIVVGNNESRLIR